MLLKEQVCPFLTVLKVDLLAHKWRYPTVSIHGIEGAFSDPGTKTVIPSKVCAKFSIRQVPNMDPTVVEKKVAEMSFLCVDTFLLVCCFSSCLAFIIFFYMLQVSDHLHSVFSKRQSPNTLKVSMVIGAKPWLADIHHPLFEAGKAAIKRGMRQKHSCQHHTFCNGCENTAQGLNKNNHNK